jgi:hypothetical protein
MKSVGSIIDQTSSNWIYHGHPPVNHEQINGTIRFQIGVIQRLFGESYAINGLKYVQ